MDSIDSELLIALVKEKPILWDKSLENYKARGPTKEAWNEICSNMMPGYLTLPTSDQVSFSK